MNNRAQFNFSNVLHTPDFAANLISISQFDEAGFKVVFGAGKAQFINPKGEVALEVGKRNGMYLFQETSAETHPIAMTARSHEKPTTIQQWH
ncbi:hypothetical protein CVT25_008793 [Psilocybe cyanescens]|uniref:Uncharacterized protein n=1 Tax=Psilocybe cyanescens TaxID=93625 RepID=A0A409XL53_PSICY|nr:hypothetical protein CVT25_008793 [Psilocybe cyanescens]